LLLDSLCSVTDGLLDELDYVGLGLESIPGGIVAIAKVGADVGSGNSAYQEEVQCGSVEQIQRKSALVLLELVVIFVFREILRYRNQLVPDIVPALQHFFGTRARRTRSLILRLGLTRNIRSDNSDQRGNNK
jgi:hypothetical protein